MAEENYTATKCCTKCSSKKSLDEFNRDKTRTDGRFPQCRECIKASAKKRYQDDPESAKIARKKDYEQSKPKYIARARKWEIENSERKKQLRADYRARNKEKIKEFSRIDWSKHNQARLQKKKEYRTQNPSKGAEHVRSRQARKIKAMPMWANREKILNIYLECRRKTCETGVRHHVDHFYPLKNALVCGLHNEYNLRIIPAAENQAKGNKFTIG